MAKSVLGWVLLGGGVLALVAYGRRASAANSSVSRLPEGIRPVVDAIGTTGTREALGTRQGPVERHSAGLVQFYDGGAVGPAVVTKRPQDAQAFWLSGYSLEMWLKTGGPAGPLGLPAGQDYRHRQALVGMYREGTRRDFDGGFIFWDRRDLLPPWYGNSAFTHGGRAIMGALAAWPIGQKVGLAGRLYTQGAHPGAADSVTRAVQAKIRDGAGQAAAGYVAAQAGAAGFAVCGPICAVVAGGAAYLAVSEYGGDLIDEVWELGGELVDAINPWS